MENEELNKNQVKNFITKKLIEEIRKDMQINEFNLEEQCRNSTNIVQKYLEIYHSRKRVLASLQEDAKYMYSEYFKKYRYGGAGVPLKADSATDAKILIERHEDYRVLQKEIKSIELLLDFLEGSIENLRQNFWMIKNIIALRELEKT